MADTQSALDRAWIPPDDQSDSSGSGSGLFGDADPAVDDEDTSSRPAIEIPSTGVSMDRLVGAVLATAGVVATVALWVVSPLLALLVGGGVFAGGGLGWWAYRAWKRRDPKKRKRMSRRRSWTLRWGRLGQSSGSRTRTFGGMLRGGGRRGSGLAGGRSGRAGGVLGRLLGKGRTGGGGSRRGSGGSGRSGGGGRIGSALGRLWPFGKGRGTGRSSSGSSGSGTGRGGMLGRVAGRTGSGGRRTRRRTGGLLGRVGQSRLGRAMELGWLTGRRPSGRTGGRWWPFRLAGETWSAARAGWRGVRRMGRRFGHGERQVERLSRPLWLAVRPMFRALRRGGRALGALLGRTSVGRRAGRVGKWLAGVVGGWWRRAVAAVRTRSSAGTPVTNLVAAPGAVQPSPVAVPLPSLTPVFQPPTPAPPARNGRTARQPRKGPTMPTTGSTDTDTLKSGYAHLIDNSTPQTLAATLGDAVGAARADADRYTTRAEELRAEAAGLEDKPGMREAAENFLREAAECDATAEDRLGMAAAYDSRAAEVATQATA